MMLRMNQYRGGYRIVSLARRIETAKFMGEQEYEFVLQQGQELLFYPGEEKVFLEKEERTTFSPPDLKWKEVYIRWMPNLEILLSKPSLKVYKLIGLIF